MKRENPILKYLFGIFLLINIIDIGTAFFILDAEFNPIYLFTGSIFGLIIWKAIILFGCWKLCNLAKYPSHFWYYLLILIMTLGIFLVGFASWSNVHGIKHPELVEEAKNIPADEKAKMYIDVLTIIYVGPMGFSIIAFALYRKSLKYIEFKDG